MYILRLNINRANQYTTVELMVTVSGIDEDNKKDVTWCTNTPQYDKVARKAVRKMFRELKPQISQDGLPRVPKSDFSQNASQLAANKTEMKLLMKAGIVWSSVVIKWQMLTFIHRDYLKSCLHK